MTDPQVGMLMMGIFILIILLGFPIAFTLMALAVGFGYYAMGDIIFQLLVQRAYGVMSNDVLISVPLFLFMGYVVERANILDRLFHSLQVATGNIPGSLAVATLATCALFATATGIVGAVVTLMGLLAFPAMLRAGYDVKLSAGVICAGGCLGILIPPSIMLILYGATAGVSVVKLYAGALLPGFMLAALYIAYVMGRAILNPKLCPKLPREITDVPFTEVAYQLATSFFPLAFLILSVLGAILLGLATPSEAAAIGALGSLLLAAGYRQLTWERLKESVFLTARASAMVCWLFIGSWTFSSVFSYLGGHTVIENFVDSLSLSTVGFLILTQIIIFLLGWPLEWTEIIIIFIPIFVPLLAKFEVDPLFFGLLVALNIQTSFNTPPMAMAAYYLKGVAPPHVKLTEIFAGSLPFVFMVFLSMAVLYIFPGVGLWLPEYLYGSEVEATPKGGTVPSVGPSIESLQPLEENLPPERLYEYQLEIEPPEPDEEIEPPTNGN
ncbi:MAG: TRAP transporter large permease subunit [Rhodospirillales bacterium]|nr:TRAP transporter large permease subunit [Rhodospirillales bacterium]